MEERNVFRVTREGNYIVIPTPQRKLTREQALDLALSLLGAFGMTELSRDVTERTAHIEASRKKLATSSAYGKVQR